MLVEEQTEKQAGVKEVVHHVTLDPYVSATANRDKSNQSSLSTTGEKGAWQLSINLYSERKKGDPSMDLLYDL